MQLAKLYGTLDEEHAQRVAHLSFRQALKEAATTTHVLNELGDGPRQQAIVLLESGRAKTADEAIQATRVHEPTLWGWESLPKGKQPPQADVKAYQERLLSIEAKIAELRKAIAPWERKLRKLKGQREELRVWLYRAKHRPVRLR